MPRSYVAVAALVALLAAAWAAFAPDRGAIALLLAAGAVVVDRGVARLLAPVDQHVHVGLGIVDDGGAIGEARL